LDSGGEGRRFGVGGVVSREKGENDKFYFGESNKHMVAHCLIIGVYTSLEKIIMNNYFN
jgi:hypothetical protein